MQEWILLLQKPVRDLENSKLLLLCKKTIPRMLNSSATQTAASWGSMQIRRKQEFYPSLSMLLNQKNPFLHCFSRQQIYIPGVFCSRAGAQGAAMLASLRAGNRPKAENIRKDFCLADYLQSDAKRKRHYDLPFSHMHRLWVTRNKICSFPTNRNFYIWEGCLI